MDRRFKRWNLVLGNSFYFIIGWPNLCLLLALCSNAPTHSDKNRSDDSVTLITAILIKLLTFLHTHKDVPKLPATPLYTVTNPVR
jgi:hypothetical protein